MESKTFRRLTHFEQMLDEGVWTKWFGAAWTLYGFVSFFRDEFLPSEVQEQTRLVEVLRAALSIPLESWIIVLLVILCAWLFEASFRMQRKSHARVLALEANLEPKFSLRFITHTSPKNVPADVPASRRWLELEVRNTSNAVLRRVCAKIFAMTNVGGISSHFEGRCFAIKGYENDAKFDAEINPNDRAHFNIALSEETPPRRTYGLSFADGENMFMPAANYPHTLTIAVTAENAVAVHRMVILSVQENHVMKIEEVTAAKDQQKAIAVQKMSWLRRLFPRWNSRTIAPAEGRVADRAV